MQSYGQFCPIARALEVLGQRWTLLVVRELLCGATRFTEIRRGIPLVPRSTLVDRLQALERAELVERVEGASGTTAYRLTAGGRALAPVLGQIASWAHEWDRRGLLPAHLDPDVLLWDIQRRLDTDALPARRTVVGFAFTDRPSGDNRLWLHLGGGEPPAVCRTGEGFEADLEVRGPTEALVRWWVGELPWRRLLADGSVRAEGPLRLQRAFPGWFRGYAFPVPGDATG